MLFGRTVDGIKIEGVDFVEIKQQMCTRRIIAQDRLSGLLHHIGASCPKMDRLGNDPCGMSCVDL